MPPANEALEKATLESDHTLPGRRTRPPTPAEVRPGLRHGGRKQSAAAVATGSSRRPFLSGLCCTANLMTVGPAACCAGAVTAIRAAQQNIHSGATTSGCIGNRPSDMRHI
jgi:hypothetical protein